MRKSSLSALLGGAALATAALAAPVAAKSIEITITSNQAVGGLYLTPLLTVLHDGSYDAFDPGAAASAGLQLLAEEGSPAAEIAGNAAGFNANVITSPGGFAGAPVIDPGETATIRVNVDPATDRFLSFLSMVIPSNDTFIGNGNPFAYELFDNMGNFTDIAPIEVTADEIWDAGTEVSNNQGAAFNAAGGDRTDENGVVTSAGDAGLLNLLGQNTAAGTTITSVPTGSQLLATISVAQVPLPAGLPLMLFALGGLGLARRARKS